MAVTALACLPRAAPAQRALPTSRPAGDQLVSPELIGRTVEEVRVIGNSQVSSQVILNLVRTHEGDKFNPTTVEADYQRIYSLKRFSDVQAKVEPTRSGVVVVFQVTEEKLIRSIKYVGNANVSNGDLEKGVDMKVGEAIEPFRISLAKRSIIATYKSKNYPFAHVDVPMDQLTRTGDLVFNITQGPQVTIRKIDFIGDHTFTKGKLNDQVKTTRWYWIFNSGSFDPDVVEDDVGSLARFYRGKGFFDVRVGRKLIFSPDQSELQINFIINEGPRYKVDRVSFTGNSSLTEAQLRQNMNLVEGQYFDEEVLQRDVKQVVKAYSPLGYIYDPRSDDPNFLRLGSARDNNSQFYPVHVVYHRQPGTVELVYEIAEGKPFHIGRIMVKGNSRSMDKLVLRELHVAPGQLYNSGELVDAVDRLRGTPYFDNATITPIGTGPDVRDLLVEVHERQTASFSVGAGFNTNYGVAGNVTFEQRNFDAAAVPDNFRDLLSDRAFTGAGQTFRATFQPGIDITNASLLFSEPYIFDLPYSNTDEIYYQTAIREAWNETRAGGRVTFGKRFDYVWSSTVTLKAEDVKVNDIEDFYPANDRVVVSDPVTGLPIIGPDGRVETRLQSSRAPEVLELAGHSTITSASLGIRRDTTNHGPVTFKGTNTNFNYDAYGALGGEFFFHRFTMGYDAYQTIYSDFLDRKTVIKGSIDAGYIIRNAPFYERFYGGGIGSLRGFEFRGVGPRDGRDQDPIGGNLNLVGSVELSYPIYGDNLRGVVFSDFGTVEPDIRIHTIRASIGTGVRLVLPFLSQQPIALDFAIPVAKAPGDQTQFFSFAFGSNF